MLLDGTTRLQTPLHKNLARQALSVKRIHRLARRSGIAFARPAKAGGPACRGKDYEEHGRTDPHGTYGYQWRCAKCGDTGTLEIVMAKLLALHLGPAPAAEPAAGAARSRLVRAHESRDSHEFADTRRS